MTKRPLHDRERAAERNERRIEQLALATFSAVALVLTAVYWISRGGLDGRLIEIDKAAPLEASFEVDINQADWPELVQLPGIGEVLAKRIVDSRRTEGPFADHADLQRVRGIGPLTLERVRPYLLPMPDGDAVVGY
jgi:competence protein ComEA